MRPPARPRRGRPGDLDRPQQLPPVPAAPLPGRDFAARVEPHRILAAQAVPPPPQRRREDGRGGRDRPRHAHRRDDGRPAPHRRRARPRGRVAAELLPHGRRRSPCVPAVLARGCRPPAVADHRCVRGCRPRARAVDRGALNFVVVGGGPTGVEMAGALADLIEETMTVEYRDLDVAAARIHVVDLGDALLGPFSATAHDYVAKVLTRKGVELHLGVAVTEIGPGHVTLADGTTIRTRCVIWGGGIMAPSVVTTSDALPHGPGGRIEVLPDPTVDGAQDVYAVGDAANIPGPAGRALPQLGSVALQSGAWAADNILAGPAGRPRRPFEYHDKGIMAMIGRGAAIAEVGARRRELRGLPAFCAWLGVHAVLMTGVRNRVETFLDWGWDYFTRSRGPQVLDRAEVARIDWSDDGPDGAGAGEASPPLTPSAAPDAA